MFASGFFFFPLAAAGSFAPPAAAGFLRRLPGLGSGHIISGPEPDLGENDGSQEVARQLVEAGYDPPEVLELAVEALDQIALAVVSPVYRAVNQTLSGRGGMGFGPAVSDQIE